MLENRIRLPALQDRIVSAGEAAALVRDGMTIGISGFGYAGDIKAVPQALVERAKTETLRLNLLSGASLGNGTDGLLTEAGLVARRVPYQSDARMRAAINRGQVMFVDSHLSEMADNLLTGRLGHLDIAIIEAVAITETGAIVPSTSVGNSANFAQLADKIIVEVNLAQPAALEGMHDIYVPARWPARQPIPLTDVADRIGGTAIQVDPDRIAAIVITDQLDDSPRLTASDDETNAIARHLIALLERDVAAGHLPTPLPPLQAGVGAIANAVLQGLEHSPFTNMTMYSEVLQDSTFALLESGKADFISGCAIVLSRDAMDRILPRINEYEGRIVLRPQEISNNPEIVRRLGLISINTAIECDIYGNVNSTHVNGTHMMNGIGGSGDFTRNAQISVFVTKSLAKDGKISSIVPMVAHVDHTEHDVDVIVTEVGLADLRGLAPRERARAIIDNCVHPSYRDQLNDYFTRAVEARGGQTPHLLEEAYSWHTRMRETGSMKA